MPRLVKTIAIAIAALLVLLLAAIGIVAATFNPNDYKPQLIRLVQEKTQRTLTIPGDIKLSFFPKLGADLGKVAISEHNSNADFASVEHARLSLALMPLLSKRFVVDRIAIDGLRATIRRNKDGSTNYDDLISRGQPAGGQPGTQPGGAQPGGGPVNFDIDSVKISNAHLLYDDQQAARRLEVDGLNLDTGRIASGVPGKLQLSANLKGNKPDIDASVAVKTGFTMDIDKKHYVLKDLDADLKGALAGFTGLAVTAAGNADLQPDGKRFALDNLKLAASGKRAAQLLEAKLDIPQLAITEAKVAGGKLSGEARLTEGTRTVTANFAAPSFSGSPQAFTLPALALDAAIKDAKLDAQAKIAGALAGDIDKLVFNSPQLVLTLSGKQEDKAVNGTLTTPISADLKSKQIALPAIAGSFVLPNPGGGTLALKAAGNASADLGKETAAVTLKGNLDESAFDARLGMAKFTPAAYTFDIGIDRLDLDRYRSKPAPASTSAPAPAPAPTAPATPAAQKSAAPEKPMDLSALQTLNANGSVRVGALKAANIRTSNVRVDLHAANGRLDINPLSAGLYGGSVAGSLSVIAGNPAHFAVRQTMSGINLAPLLKDATGKEPIEGKGNVQLDVTTVGLTTDQLKKALNGSARLALRDGSVHGVNIAQVIRNAKAKIGEIRGDAPAQTGTGSAGEKTDFSELTGSFRIASGVAHNDDLDIKSPLVRIGGAGDIDIGNERINYLAKVTVVASLQGQGGPELQALKGVTVPVQLSGPFTAMSWHIDFAGMAGELAKAKARQAIEQQKGKVQEQLQDRLKGLFGK